MRYRIGLDLGIGSIGWSVLENDTEGKPKRIVDLGVRVFDEAENPKDGSPLAKPRRDARELRRRLRRKKHRIDRTKKLLDRYDILKESEIEKMYQDKNFTKDVYELRVLGLDKKLSSQELVRVLIHLVKRRGYKSNSKSEEKENKEAGKLLMAIKENEELMKEKNYRTVAEMYLKDEKYKQILANGEELQKIRNTTNEYKATILRKDLRKEIEMILDKQKELNEKITDSFIEEYLSIFESQRNFDEGPGEPSPYGGNQIEKMLGKCTFEKEEFRAPKACYTFEYFKLLQDINHIKIIKEEANKTEKRELTQQEREQIIQLAREKSNLHFGHIRKILQLEENEYFNMVDYDVKIEMQEIEKKKAFKELESYHKIKKGLTKIDKNNIEKFSEEQLDDIGYALTIYKNDEKREAYLKEKKVPLSQEEMTQMLELSFTKVGNLSLKAMKKIIPFLEKGLTYDKAVNEVYSDFRGTINGKKVTKLSLKDLEQEISNPVVRRSISQTIKVINAIVLKYGLPEIVVIELARELSKNFDDRRKIKKEYEENQKNNERMKVKIEELGKTNPTGQDIVKMKLWEEQNHICIYSGKVIKIEELFTEAVDVDHIIPYSICFDDSYQNKVLVLASENRQKGNRIPYQYLQENKKDMEEYEVRVNNFIKNSAKRRKLLKKNVTKEEIEDWKNRNIQDTQYISKLIYNLIKNNLQFSENKEIKRKVYAVNGRVTAHIRKRLGIEKIRADGDIHHAVDAVVIAATSQSMIQKITKYYQYKEARFENNLGEYLDYETGELFSKEEYEIRWGSKFPEPWPKFRTELEIRLMNSKERMLEAIQSEKMYDYDIENLKPIFVSRMPRRKVKGQAHMETIRGMKKEANRIKTVTKTELTKLKLDKDGEIKGYLEKNKKDDRLLYEALKKQLKVFDGDGAKAFKEPFYRPKKDGTLGPLVKKVQIEDPITMGVEINQSKGIASNGEMVRLDIFYVKKDGYYFIPIYVSDTIKKELPNKACVQNKPKEEWKVMKEEDFIFSLYPGDLIKVISKREIKLSPNKNEELDKIEVKELMAYYVSANISTGAIHITTQERRYKQDGLGIKSLQSMEKYEVDLLGNYHKVKIPEKRLGFQNKRGGKLIK